MHGTYLNSMAGLPKINSKLVSILAAVTDGEVVKTDTIFWLFVKIFVGIIAIFVAIIAFDIAQIQLNLLALFNGGNINDNG